LEDRRSKDDKMSRRVWEAMKVKAGKTEVVKVVRGRKEKKKERKKEKTKGSRMINVKKVAEEWKIWNKKEEAARLEEKVKKLIPKQFHK